MRHQLARAMRWLAAEHLVLPLAALATLFAELVALRALYMAAFGGERRIPEWADLPLGHAILWGLGLTAGALAAVATYRLIRRGRAWVAALVVPLVCFPVLVVGLGSAYGSLLVAGIV